MRLREVTLEFAPHALPIRDKMAVRQATGLPYEAFVSSDTAKVGEDTFLVLWWVGRRANGETKLSLDTVINEWVPIISDDDLELELIVDDGAATDDAGKSVPA
jgi:hypothetical protein